MPHEAEHPGAGLSQGQEEPDPLGEYERHPAALRPWPMPPWRFEKLKAGISHIGLQYPIEVQAGNPKYLLRGWHRLLACRDLAAARGPDPKWAVKTVPVDVPDDKVEDYTAAEAATRELTATERALWTKEVVLPAVAAR